MFPIMSLSFTYYASHLSLYHARSGVHVTRLDSSPGMQFIGWPWGGDDDSSEVGGTGGTSVGIRVGDSAVSQSQVQALMFDVHDSITCWSSSCSSSSWTASSSWRTHGDELIQSSSHISNFTQGGLLLGSYLLWVNSDQGCTTSIHAWNVEADESQCESLNHMLKN